MRLPARREVETLGTVLAAGAAVIAALFAASTWQQVLGWRQGEPFGVTDPVLGFDVGFYVFTLPVLEQARSLALALVGLAIAGAGALYLLGGQVAITPFGVRLGERARRHLGLLIALLLVLMAAGAWLDRPRTLLTPTGIIRGAGYTDVHARLPFALAEMAAALVGAGLAAVVRLHRSPGGGGRRRRALRRGGPRRTALRHRDPALRGRPERAGTRSAVHPVQHRGDAPRLRPRPHRAAAAHRRRRADPRRHRPQPRHARQRAALGSPAAARDLRADPGDPHLLRLHGRGQRSLRDRRPAAPGDAVGPRAEPGGAAQPHLGQRAPDLHPRPRPHARPGEPGHGRRAAGAVHPRSAAGLDGEPAGDRAEPVLRRALERIRDRADQGPRVPLPEGRRQRLLDLRGQRRHRPRLAVEEAGVRDPLPRLPAAALRRHHGREPPDLRPPDRPARAEDRAVPHLRRRSVSGRPRRPALLDHRRLHDDRPLSVRLGGGRASQLHPQRRQGGDRRLSRHDHVLPGRARRPDRPRLRQGVSGAVHAARADAGRPAPPRALPRGHLRHAGGGLLDLPHDQSRRSSTTRKTSGRCRRSTAAARRCGCRRTTRS